MILLGLLRPRICRTQVQIISNYIIFYTEIFTGKIVWWSFFTRELSGKIYKIQHFHDKISIFFKWTEKDITFIFIEFGKITFSYIFFDIYLSSVTLFYNLYYYKSRKNIYRYYWFIQRPLVELSII